MAITDAQAIDEATQPPENCVANDAYRIFHSAGPIQKDISDEMPPHLTNWVDFVPDYEGILGSYIQASRKVILFRRSIASVSAKIDVHPVMLQRVVEFHEFSHALHHLGVPSSQRLPPLGLYLREREALFLDAPAAAKESLAQLTTIVAIRNQKRNCQHPEAKKFFAELERVFRKLMSHQSPVYRLERNVLKQPISRLTKKLALLYDLADDHTYVSREDHLARVIA